MRTPPTDDLLTAALSHRMRCSRSLWELCGAVMEAIGVVMVEDQARRFQLDLHGTAPGTIRADSRQVNCAH
jgi:hypothetical protein